MYEWSWGIFAKKTKFHDAGGPGTVVSPFIVCEADLYILMLSVSGLVSFKVQKTL